MADIESVKLPNGNEYDIVDAKTPRASDLDDLGDVVITTPTADDVLQYNSTTGKWVNRQVSGASAADTSYDNTSSGLSATNVQDGIDEIADDLPTVLSDLSDVNLTGLLHGDTLQYNGNTHKWEPQRSIFPSLTFADIHEFVSRGQAKLVFSIGDQITVPYTATNGTVYQMPFDVVHFDDEVELEDGSKVPGMYLQSHYATLEAVQFDAPEPDNANNDIKLYGYNRWSESGMRAWLNSDSAANGWWSGYFERNGTQTARRAADVAPTQLSSVNGFMRGLPSEFLAILGETKISTSCNTVTDSGVTDVTYDKFFLPSVEQIYCTPEVSGVEGDYWEYWKERLGLTSPAATYPTTYANYTIYTLENHSISREVRLRSAYRHTSYQMWANLLTYIYVFDGNSSLACRCTPCCVVV